jgi:tetratricopeptide (TPR) repeat protein
MSLTLKKLTVFYICLSVVCVNAQKQEPECKKFEEGLYLNTILNKPVSPQRFIDSITGCMTASVKMHLTVGKYYYNNDDYKNAEREYRKVLSAGTASKKELAESCYYLNLCAYHVGNYDASIQYSFRALEYGYYAVWCNDNIGLALSKQGDQVQAIKFFEQALKLDPKYSSAANNIGIAYYRMHNEAMALVYYRVADSLAGGRDPVYASNIFRSLSNLKRDDEAAAHIKRVYPKFMNNKLIIADYTRVLHDEKKYDQVLVNARRLYYMRPVGADEWFDIGYAYFDGGQLDTAFYAYNIALRYDPKKLQTYSNLILIYNLLGMHKEADAKLDVAFTLDSNYWYFYERKYSINEWQYKFEEAYKWASQLQKKFGTPQKSFDFQVGWSLLHLKRYEEAITHFRIELAKAPADDRLLNNIGRCYTGLKQIDSAMSYFDRAMRINPENSYIYHNRAALYALMGKPELACSDLRTAIDKEYNWLVDENLEKVKKLHCPEVNTNIKILIHEYKGNKAQFGARYNFIKLSDSLLNEKVTERILKDMDNKSDRDEKDTRSVFDAFKVYPNPSQDVFNIEGLLEFPEPLTIKVFNESGALVLNSTMSDMSTRFSMRGHANGIYVLMISSNTSVLSVKKIVVQN